MNLLLFFAFAPIFVAATTLLINSVLILSSDRPWDLDSVSNKLILQIAEGMSFDEWFESLGKNQMGIYNLMIMFYHYSALITILVSIIILLLLFFGNHNRILFTSSYSVWCFILLLMGLFLKDYSEQSYHVRYYLLTLVSNSFGLFCYILNWLHLVLTTESPSISTEDKNK